MNRNYFYIVLGITGFCLLLILFSLLKDRETNVQPPGYVNFPVAPFKTYITGLGVVQAKGGNVMLGAATDRIVDQILVHAGEPIEKDEVLIKLQNNDLQAELQAQKVAYETAKVNYEKLLNLPRKEDLVLAEASVKNATLQHEMAKDQYEMVEGLEHNRAISLEEINRRFYNYQMAEVKLEQAEAEAEKVKQGAWKPDLETGRLQMVQAESNVKRIEAELAKTEVKSPVNGTVIEIKTRVGEYPTYPIAIVGDTHQLELKVSINQFDSHSFSPKAKAVAYLQGDPTHEVALEFVRVIPYLMSKQNLTNDVKEIVDTKVLKVVYKIKNVDPRIIVGQPMDVYIETESKP